MTSSSESKDDRLPIRTIINGRAYELHAEPRRTLADLLREDCGLTGTHLGCEHGVCGACTVLVDGNPIRACLMLGVQASGHEIETVESLADGESLSPLQRAFMENHALQCGYCTPGFLMLIKGAVERNSAIDDEELVHLLSSNLCRCTGYTGIIAAAKAFRDHLSNRRP